MVKNCLQTTMKRKFVNISAYKFIPIDDVAERRREWLALSRKLELKGTILLSKEGVNMFLAGTREAMDTFLDTVRADERFVDLPIKESFSDYQPFTRMLVRIKKEIISMGVPTIKPAVKTSPKISAERLKEWLDSGKDVTLLDVRNDYEVEIGTFKEAMPIGVDSFREFPEKIKSLPGNLKEKPIVMFCTGGIRCEKAGPIMEDEGFQEIYQLDGGILKYFESCGGDHYDGECFVFDKRVALDPELEETDTEQCYACQAILSAEDQLSELYDPPRSCPSCFVPPDEKLAALIASRNEEIAAVVDPLPGSQPYDNIRPINVPLKFDRKTALEFLFGMHPHVGKDYWASECDNSRIIYKNQPIGRDRVVRSGWRVEHLLPQTVEPDVNADIRLLYEDESLLLINKPAPIPMHACGRFNRNSLIQILGLIYSGERLRIAHRLDANTSGLVIICRKRAAADTIRNFFEAGRVSKTYLARVYGAEKDEFECDAKIAKEPSIAGVRVVDAKDGLEALTEFRTLKRFEDGTSLVECQPKTGRTNQIRVHLWTLGCPIVGDPSYMRNGQIHEAQTLSVDDPPMCLHAWKLEFPHPVTKITTRFESEPPTWASSKISIQ